MTMIDTIRAVFTYVIVLAVVVGGFLIIFATRSDPNATDTRLMIAGFIGSALTFTFSTEVQTRTARQTSAATAQGANGNGVSPIPPA